MHGGHMVQIDTRTPNLKISNWKKIMEKFRMNKIKKMGRQAGLLLLGLCLALGASSCGTVGADPRGDGILTVVTTSFAGFDFARQLTKDAPAGSVELVLLGKPGQDMHSFEPTAADITTLSRADILIEVGHEAWLDATLKASLNTAVERVNMMTVCDTMAETPTEGMDTAAEHDHDHDHGDEDGLCALIGTDEHVWLSTGNAERIAAAIGAALETVDAPRAELWQTNTAAYTAELAQLTADYAAMRAGAVRDTILIADRYPFAYLVRQLELTCHAAFPGCSSETSASFETQTFLIRKTRELALPYIFMMDGSDGTMATVIAAEGGAEILTLDSLQVVTDRSKTYIGVMRDNLEQLRRALY